MIDETKHADSRPCSIDPTAMTDEERRSCRSASTISTTSVDAVEMVCSAISSLRANPSRHPREKLHFSRATVRRTRSSARSAEALNRSFPLSTVCYVVFVGAPVSLVWTAELKRDNALPAINDESDEQRRLRVMSSPLSVNLGSEN